MDAVSNREHGMFSCSATFADILIIGEQLRTDLHNEKSLIKDQRYHFRWHNCSFVGVEVVSWLVKTQRAAERFIAVALMNILLEHHIIRHVTGSVAFKDDSHLYRFRNDDGTYDYGEDTLVFSRGHRLCKRLMSDPQGRKVVRTHASGGAAFTHSVLGCELIDWMVQRHEAPSREEALKELRVLLESGVIRHVLDAHHFRDDQSLYQFRSDFGRDRLLLDLILPPPQPEFGNAIIEDWTTTSSSTATDNRQQPKSCIDNNNLSGSVGGSDVASGRSPDSDTPAKDIPDGCGDRVGTERTESGYHSDHLSASPHSSLSESPMFDLEDRDGRKEKTTPFSGGVLIRKATVSELENPNSPYIKKFIRIVSDPVGYGFVIRGDGPVFIKTVDPQGPAAAAGLKVGHYIYSVNDHKVLSQNHRDLAHVILGSNGYITLVVMEHVRDSR